jgi:hypothetical protein
MDRGDENEFFFFEQTKVGLCHVHLDSPIVELVKVGEYRLPSSSSSRNF